MARPHVVAIPYPAQGHVHPLMQIIRALAKQDIKITVVNTEFIHNELHKAMGDKKDTLLGSQIELVAVSDGFGPQHNRNNVEWLFVHMMNNLRVEFEKLLTHMAAEAENAITCVLVDLSMAWVLEIADKLGIRGALFSAHSAAHSVINVSVEKLIEDGVIDYEGVPLKEQVQLIPGMPHVRSKDFPWSSLPIQEYRKRYLFDHLVSIRRGFELSKWCLVNTAYELESASIRMQSKMLPVGPLMPTEMGQLWKEDTSCLDWLDQQPPSSVIYMAFGSTGYINRTQFQELAMGFELIGRPFLWVVRPGSEHEFPEDFKGTNAKIISWAPQQKVLRHPSVACFLSHCGWNSAVEGLNNGLPFLCWPCVGDHFLNQSYIDSIWKIGLSFAPDENGIVSRWEVKKKVDQVLGDEGFKARSAVLREKMKKSRELGGLSSTNIEKFISWVKVEDNSI